MILLNNIWFLFYNKKCYFKIVIEYPHKSLIVLKWILDEQNQAKLGLTFFSLEFLKGHNANEICFCDRFFIHSSFPTFITSCTEKKLFFRFRYRNAFKSSFYVMINAALLFLKFSDKTFLCISPELKHDYKYLKFIHILSHISIALRCTWIIRDVF